MSALLAALAAVAAVGAAWEAVVVLEQASPAHALARLLAPLRADGPAPALELRRLAVVAAAAGAAAGWLVAGPPAAVLCAAGGPLAVRATLRVRRRRRAQRLAAAAPAVARALADALAGGHGVRGALVAAHSAELRPAARALALGASTEAVLEELRRRASDPGWDTLVAAILLARDHGGDLAGLLRASAAALEESARLRADARGATAQARFTAWLVALLPAGAAAIAALARPGAALALVASPVSCALLVAAGLCQVCAAVAIRRIARLDGR